MDIFLFNKIKEIAGQILIQNMRPQSQNRVKCEKGQGQLIQKLPLL